MAKDDHPKFVTHARLMMILLTLIVGTGGAGIMVLQIMQDSLREEFSGQVENLRGDLDRVSGRVETLDMRVFDFSRGKK